MAGLQFLRGFLAHALELRELLRPQGEKIRRRAHPVAVHQLLDQLVAEPLDVERAARGEMLDLFLALRRAGPSAGAARHRLIGLAHHRRSAHRADAGQGHRLRSRHPALEQHSRHFRNHIPGAADDHGIAHPHVLASQFIHVVQGRIADGDAADECRFEPRHRASARRCGPLEIRCRAPWSALPRRGIYAPPPSAAPVK